MYLAAMLGTGLVVSRPVSAAAHVCATPASVVAGRDAQVTVSVPAEEVPATRVDVAVDARAFRVAGAKSPVGWTRHIAENLITFSGGRIEAFGCERFTLFGTFQLPGRFVLPVTVGFANGTSRTLTSDRLGSDDSGQIVFATKGAAVEEHKSANDARRTAMIAALAALGCSSAIALVAAVRRRRRHHSRSDSP